MGGGRGRRGRELPTPLWLIMRNCRAWDKISCWRFTEGAGFHTFFCFLIYIKNEVCFFA